VIVVNRTVNKEEVMFETPAWRRSIYDTLVGSDHRTMAMAALAAVAAWPLAASVIISFLGSAS
jgi:hypothetical protein